MYIYVIRNSVTGKVYIGQHKGDNLKKYLQTKLSDASRFRGGQSRLYASMRKHPKEVWSIEPLMELETKEELDRLEALLIALYDTRNPEVGYNICKGGEGFTGKHTEEAKRKCAEAGKLGGAISGPAVGKRNAESGRVSVIGKLGGRAAVKSGQLASVTPLTRAGLKQWIKEHPEEHAENCSIAGRKNIETGHMERMRSRLTPELLALGGRVSMCNYWNIRRSKPCTCGRHQSND